MIPIANSTPTDRAEGRLLNLAALFLGLYSLALSLAPVVRGRSLQTAPDLGHWLGFAIWLALFNLLHIFSARRLPNRDPFLLPIAGMLTGWGLLTIFRLFPDFGLRQTVWLVIVVGLFLFGLRLSPDFRFLRRYKYLWLVGGILLTGLTFILGVNPLGYGPRMWLGGLGIYIQPSEPLKLLLIIYLAAYLADRMALPGGDGEAQRRSLLPLLAPTLVMTGLALLLLVVQRDLGTASIFLFLYAVIVYVASGRRRVALAAVAILIAASAAGYFLFDVVRVRFDAWLNPWLDPSGRSYQIVQSLLAAANGGLVGRGPGLGNPGLVPVAHSDFIFAAIFEETGLVGAIGLILLLAFLADTRFSQRIARVRCFPALPGCRIDCLSGWPELFNYRWQLTSTAPDRRHPAVCLVWRIVVGGIDDLPAFIDFNQRRRSGACPERLCLSAYSTGWRIALDWVSRGSIYRWLVGSGSRTSPSSAQR